MVIMASGIARGRVRATTELRNMAAKLQMGWPAPLYNLYFDSFLLICNSFVVRIRCIVCVVYLLSRLANYKAPCKRCVLASPNIRLTET